MRHGLPRNCLFRIPVAKIVEILYSINCGAVKYRADMMELADMQDLGSCAVRRVGSNPTIRSIKVFLDLSRNIGYSKIMVAVRRSARIGFCYVIGFSVCSPQIQRGQYGGINWLFRKKILN